MREKIAVSLLMFFILINVGYFVWKDYRYPIATYFCGPRVIIQPGPPVVTKNETCTWTTVMLMIHKKKTVLTSKPGCRCITEINDKSYISLQPTPEKCLDDPPEEPEEEREEVEL